MAAKLGKRLTIKQLAEHHGKTEAATRKWVWALERRYGGIIKRAGAGNGKGAKIEVTLASLRKADPDYLEDQAISRDEVAELKKKNVDLQNQVALLRKRLRELQDLVEILANKRAT